MHTGVMCELGILQLEKAALKNKMMTVCELCGKEVHQHYLKTHQASVMTFRGAWSDPHTDSPVHWAMHEFHAVIVSTHYMVFISDIQ